MNRPLTILVNVLAFNVCWTITIVGVGRWWWWLGPAVVLFSAAMQGRLSPRPKAELVLLLVGAVIGVATDGIGMALGMFQFAGGAIEFVVAFAALWVNFGTTVRPSLSWLWNRPFLAAALGAAAAPLNYAVAARLGAIEFGAPTWHALVWVAVQYGLVLPAWVLAAPRLIGEQAGTDPQSFSLARTPIRGTPAP